MAEEAIRLSPLDPEMALFLGAHRGRSLCAPGDMRKRSEIHDEALRLRPGFQGAQRLRCASLAQTGRIDEARSYLATVRREQPQLSLDWIRASVPYQTPGIAKAMRPPRISAAAPAPPGTGSIPAPR